MGVWAHHFSLATRSKKHRKGTDWENWCAHLELPETVVVNIVNSFNGTPLGDERGEKGWSVEAWAGFLSPIGAETKNNKK